MTSDPRARRFRHKIHLIVPFLGFILPKTDQKCMIYVIFKEKFAHELSSFIFIYLKIVNNCVK